MDRTLTTIRRGTLAGATFGAVVVLAGAASANAAPAESPTGITQDAGRVSVLGGAPCGSKPRFDHDPVEIESAKEKAVIRDGSGPSCAETGTIFPGNGELFDPACYVYAPNNGHRWVYLWANGGSGWVRADHLNGGTNVDCPEF